MRCRRFPSLALAALLAVGGCRDAPIEDRGPRLVLRDSLELVESDSLYLGRPVFLTPAGGGYYVADAFLARVVQFGADGRAVRSVGKRGLGPGEFSTAGYVLLLDDSTIAVSDDRKLVFSLFGRADGRYRRELAHGAVIRDGVRSGPHVWVGALDMARGTGLLRWDLATDSLVSLLPIPPTYAQSPPLAGINTIVDVDAWRDTVVAGFSGTNDVLILGEDGTVHQRMAVPAVRRKGVPADIVGRLARPRVTFPDMFAMSSVLFHLHRLSDGSLALVHYDQQLDGKSIEATVYVSVISPDRRRACVDAVLPTGTDAQPVTAFAGDTLYLLEQELGEGTRASTWLKRYGIDATACRWHPVSGS